ncbi:MAG: bifunctional UDP-N-acetylglucosamine diphosphorylase/glucosamine-1-phosphate N-acetyltransferase GlmU [Pseudomonadota bacterium]
MTASILGILLAAGEGTRMHSRSPKVLHKVAGRPMVGHVQSAMAEAGITTMALVVGNGAEKVADAAKASYPETQIFVQSERLGTAHAVLAARDAIEQGFASIVIGYGDTPLVTPGLFMSIINELETGADVVVLGFHSENPTGYGRLIMDQGKLTAICEEKDATPAERQITFCNSGIMGLSGSKALDLLDAIGNDNAKGEFYLTDAVAVANARGLNVRSVEGKEEDTLGVNNRIELAAAEACLQERLRAKIMENGVTLVDPNSTFLSYDTEIGADTIIEPNCFFAPGVKIAEDVTIKANCYLEGDTKKGQFVTVASGAVIGPFARLRPGASLMSDVKVGNFCEVKNASVGRGAKINHLTYIGDATLGADANIGAGTITCNYDGFSKYITEIGEGAFIGSNSALVAPVSIGNGAYVASGSVITDNVSDDALAIGRGRQVQKDMWAAKMRAKRKY